jgi:hypothetical protein
MRRSKVGFAALGLAFAVTLVLSPVTVFAVDVLMEGQSVAVTRHSHFRPDGVRFNTGDGNLFPLPSGSDDPREVGATLTVLDTGGGAGSDTFDLPASGWKKVPPGNPGKANAFEYKGGGSADDPCNYVNVRPQLVKAFCKGITLSPPFTGDVGIILTIGSMRYCAEFGGSTIKNNGNKTSRLGAPAPAACSTGGGGTTSTTAPGGGTTSTSIAGGGTTSTSIAGGGTTSTSTPEGSTTSTSVAGGGTTSTSTPEGSTTSTSIAGGGTTSTSTPEGSTTSTSVAGGGTTSTSTPGGSSTSTSTPESSTTTTSIGGGGCCNGQPFVSFSTVTAPGDCGDIIAAPATLFNNIQCAGLYTGGGGNSVPLPLAVPDLGQAISAIAECTGQTAILGPSTSDETGSNRNCTNTGCLFGAPLAVPNPSSIPTSVCVTNTASQPLTGTAVCDTGETQAVLPLTSTIFLTGDSLGGVDGIQPCPLCSNTMCIGGPNDGDTCVAGTTAINASYPTSHDCPPDPMTSIGSLPVAFSLTTGTVTWSGTVATNDTGSTASSQTRVFSGFCRDVALPGGSGSFDVSADPGGQFQQCWENGMAKGVTCSEALNSAESCEQRNPGAFGPNGNNIRTIQTIGNAMSILGGPAFGTLVSIFSIPPTFDATIDGAGDLPGPGAVAIPGTARLCSSANPCP